MCCVGFAGWWVCGWGARRFRGRRARFIGGSIWQGCIPDLRICPTYVHDTNSVGDSCHLELFLSSTLKHPDLFVGESIPRRFVPKYRNSGGNRRDAVLYAPARSYWPVLWRCGTEGGVGAGGGARTSAERGGACLTAAARRRMQRRRCTFRGCRGRGVVEDAAPDPTVALFG